MDPALLKQRAQFKARAARALDGGYDEKPSSSQQSHSTYDADAARRKRKKVQVESQPLTNPLAEFGSKITPAASNAANFGTMAKIVDYMKKRHLLAQHWPLSLPEILEELQLYDLGKKAEAWLQETLPTNPRLTADENGKFVFKPPYRIKGKNSLLAILKKSHMEGNGGILLSDLNECIPNVDKTIEALGNGVIGVSTLINKRKDQVYFYNDTETDYEIDESLKSLWRNASVDHLDEKKIEEYLQKHGIDTMQDLAPKKLEVAPPKRKTAKKRVNQKVHNEHMADVLEDYEAD